MLLLVPKSDVVAICNAIREKSGESTSLTIDEAIALLRAMYGYIEYSHSCENSVVVVPESFGPANDTYRISLGSDNAEAAFPVDFQIANSTYDISFTVEV